MRGLKEKRLLILLLIISLNTFAKVDIKMVEPMIFKSINTEALGTKVLAKGVIEVSTDNRDEDYGKLLKFIFPKVGFLSNRKHWIKVEGFYIERDRDEHIIERERERINFYGIIDRKDIGKWEVAPEVIEGEYIGYIPINIAQYSSLSENNLENSPEKDSENLSAAAQIGTEAENRSED